VLDIHIGVISSSLGARGGKACEPEMGRNHDDSAHLIHRTDPLEPEGGLATFQNKGFLAWQPEATSAEAGMYRDVPALGTDLESLVRGVGENGCGYEAQLESFYRFLVDPEPYLAVEPTFAADKKQTENQLTGRDDELLQQRRDFLRPDSLVAIVMLSDENDCSYRSEGYGWVTGDIDTLKSVRARAECSVDPNDPCCAPCHQPPVGCPADPTCDADPPADHHIPNLACFDQKRRYGVDLLYPVERYVQGLSSPQVPDRAGQLVANPLLVSQDGVPRGLDRVYLAGIVGVPWQLIARDPANLETGFQNASELSDNGTWDVILGDPKKNVPPSDPHMVESVGARPALPGVSSGPLADPIVGHEFRPKLENGWGDVQYACTFELPTEINCDATYTNCDCNPNQIEFNPLCQAPDGSYGNIQYRAKGYPGRRQLQVLKGIGQQAIVGSICPAQMGDKLARDYGYRPAIDALIERLKQRLRGLCLLRQLEADVNGQVSCLVLEGRKLGAGESCDCTGNGRSPVRVENQQAVKAALEQPVAQAAGLDCFCSIDQLADEALDACQESTDVQPTALGEPVHGWCYIDAGSFPKVGNPALVEHCLQTDHPRTIRFVGEGEPVSGAMAFVSCQQ
jgi:hypothetical protein